MKRLVLLLMVFSAAAGVTGVRQPYPPPDSVEADALFDDNVVHSIRLAVNSKDWQTLKDRYLENTYYPADFRWREQVVRNVGIRSRGTGSRSGTKPGLTVSFGRYTSQKFLGLESIILRNNTQDPSNMRERLSMLLFGRMGLPASREAYARLYVNGEYVGLYTIVESVDEAFCRRSFGDGGGYLFDYDYPSDAQPYHFEYRGADPALYVPLPFKPDTHKDDPKGEVLVRLIETINLTSDAVFRTAIAEYLDLGQFVRHLAVEQFLQDNDGLLGDWGMNNYYLYRQENTNLFTFVAWDKSNAFVDGFTRSIWHNIRTVPAAQRNRLVARALSYPDLLSHYVDALLECARSAGEFDQTSPDRRGWLEREIEREYQQIRSAVLADPVKPYTNEAFEVAIDELRMFARGRGDSVNGQVAEARAGSLGVAYKPQSHGDRETTGHSVAPGSGGLFAQVERVD